MVSIATIVADAIAITVTTVTTVTTINDNNFKT